MDGMSECEAGAASPSARANRADPSRRVAHALRGLGRRLSAAVVAVIHRRRSRRLLAEMEPRMLKDIGIAPQDANFEAHRFWWQPWTIQPARHLERESTRLRESGR